MRRLWGTIRGNIRVFAGVANILPQRHYIQVNLVLRTGLPPQEGMPAGAKAAGNQEREGLPEEKGNKIIGYYVNEQAEPRNAVTSNTAVTARG